jgi:predicted metal-dependent hydrolase
MTLPSWAGQKEAEKFLKEHEDKIIKMLAKQPVVQPLPTDVLTILGTPYTLKLDPVRTKGVWHEEGVLWVGGKTKNPSKILEQWIMDHAHAFFTAHAHPHANHLGRKIRDIKIRDMKSRWGSCRSSGSITFSWRLLLAPREVTEYVSFHEICHLKEMNHSPRFWKLVEAFCPDYKKHRHWLRTEGKMLAHVKLDSFLS